jgi:type VI secretion system protein VasG
MSKYILKLNPICLDILEAALSLVKLKGNFYLEIEHFLFKGLTNTQADLQNILRHYDIDISTTLKQINATIERTSSNCVSSATYSPHFLMLLERGWLISSIDLDLPYICSSALLLALVDYDPLRGLMLENCPLLLRIPRASFRQEIQHLTTTSFTQERVLKANQFPISS